MQLLLIRHTTPQVPAGICYGQSDIDVAASFNEEFIAIVAKLNSLKLGGSEFHAIVSSPLQRCTKLAYALNVTLDLGNINEDDRLKELNFGDWELQAWDGIPRAEFDRWADDYANTTPPNGETFAELHKRSKAFILEMSEYSAKKNIIVITHGGLIRAMLAEVLQIPLKHLFRFQIDYGSLTHLTFDGVAPRIICVNR